jgi:hypothetical protein
MAGRDQCGVSADTSACLTISSCKTILLSGDESWGGWEEYEVILGTNQREMLVNQNLGDYRQISMEISQMITK